MLLCHKNLKTNLQPLNAKAMSHLNPCTLPSVTHEILHVGCEGQWHMRYYPWHCKLHNAVSYKLQCCILKCCVNYPWLTCGENAENSVSEREATRFHLSHSPSPVNILQNLPFEATFVTTMFQSAKEVRGVWKVYLAASVTFCPYLLRVKPNHTLQ